MKKLLHIVFFDVGGTLVSAPDLYDVFWENWGNDDRISKKIFYQVLYQIKNKGTEFCNVKAMLSLLAKKIATEYGVKDLSLQAANIYNSVYLDSVSLCAGVIEILSFLKDRNISLIIVSDADADVLRPQLRKLGINLFFDQFIISSEIGGYKPSDAMIRAVNKHCIGTRNGMLMVGDSRDDVLTADKLGIASALITPSNEITCSFPHFTIPDFSSLQELLERNYFIGEEMSDEK